MGIANHQRFADLTGDEAEDGLVPLLRGEEDPLLVPRRGPNDARPDGLIHRVAELIRLYPDSAELVRVVHVDDGGQVVAIVTLIELARSHGVVSPDPGALFPRPSI